MRKVVFILTVVIFCLQSCTQNKPQMVRVKGGTFWMGSNNGENNEKPVHSVSVSSFDISKTEITNAQYAAFLNDCGISSLGDFNGESLINLGCCELEFISTGNLRWQVKAGYENYPIVCVTWYGACEYCKWAGGRLPTEAEWEYAARGGNKNNDYTYAGSNNIEEVAWYNSNSGGKVHEVASKKPNELDIYDMSGNVWEWCYDRMDIYPSDPRNNPANTQGDWNYYPKCRVSRGGGCNNNTYCRVSFRGYLDHGTHSPLLGFRLVRSSVMINDK